MAQGCAEGPDQEEAERREDRSAERTRASNVVSLMDALRQSVKAERSGGRRNPARTHRRAAKKAGRSQASARKAS